MHVLERATTRRDFLKAVGLGAVGTVVAGGAVSVLGRGLVPAARGATTTLSLVATDGYTEVPGRPGNPLYIFGFVKVPDNLTVSQLITTYKGHTKTSAPTLDFLQNDDIKITLTNLGLVQRPDLTDSHTIHWHGFDMPSPLNDGVPEVSVGVPIGKQLTYFYRPHREGTYMYHCHFEDVEHVQMGMTGIVFVRPTQDGSSIGGFTKFAYNDGDGSTGYHRHFAILLNEFWSQFHDGDRDIQESRATDYDPEWFILNGRCYPETVLPNDADAWPRADRTCGSPPSTRRSAPPTTRTKLRADPGEPRRARAAPAGQPRLPAARHAAAGHPAARRRPGRLAAAQRQRRHLVLDEHAVHRPRRGARRALRRPGLQRRPAHRARTDAAATTSTTSRTGTGGGCPTTALPGPGGMMTEVRVYQNALPAQTVVSQTYV